ncbi:hypothetical protein AVDCRST_MAG81-5475 [uncultured Synechococcales cyanobacterium]|uniref:Uncharacterized protein n=1 Tax=uncultured Synechococcales cyanobacterium TaxID=1936017 RepID=A0A6J4VWT3_9CYAN|nr:hypothetical protein AVDCRST_MAG81-5475 [uncultured Synechococcales cyanobacterium]
MRDTVLEAGTPDSIKIRSPTVPNDWFAVALQQFKPLIGEADG